MPVSITKKELPIECIQEMVKKAFGQEAEHITELTEGFFNIAYRVQVNGRFAILKIAPPQDVAVMTHEKNIMFSEVDAMRLVKKETCVPVPEIYYYDDSHTICDRTYFFMEMLDGESFSGCMERMTQEQKDSIFREIGVYTKALNGIKGRKFGYYCQEERQGENWYEVFKSMVEDTFADAERKDIIMPVEKLKLIHMLEKDRKIFEEVKQPVFVHWDIWAGNVFVKNTNVTGIIDFERCLWADALMEVGFRTYGCEKSFFEGYEIAGLTKMQTRRAKWYDIYLFLIQCLEGEYRMYDDTGIYEWASDQLIKWVHETAEGTFPH